jgi:sulfate transport system ATP-binding protein
MAGRHRQLDGRAVTGPSVEIQVEDLTKSFGSTLVLDRIELKIREGEFLGLLGPSGSGKTTLLRVLAGLDWPEQGRVLFDGVDVLDVPLEQRPVGLVFQHYALFPHMRVFDNVAFGLEVMPRRRRPPKQEIADRVERLLELVQLEDLADRFPGQLSGGQRQRVALARTLAIEPQLLLLDEPFGALDAKVRVELRRWLRDLHDSMGITTVFVTHDQEEALDLADRVAVMNEGRIEQVGSPTQIYEKPKTPFVYDFLGEANKFDCEVEDGVARVGNKALPVGRRMRDGPAVAYVRPHDVVLRRIDDRSRSEDAVLPGEATVRFVSALGAKASVELSYEDRLVEAEITRENLAELEISRGKRCRLQLRLPHIFPKDPS